MSNRNFDERYPSMFQPGGDGDERPAGVPVESGKALPSLTGAALAPATVPKEKSWPVTEKPDYMTAASGRDAKMASTAWPPWRWFVAVGAAIAMIAAGVFALTAQYWVPSSMETDPSKFQGIELQPWGQVVFAAAPALMTAGTAILAALLFLASRRKAEWEPALRTSFAVAAVTLAIAGWVGMFAIVIFPGAMSQWSRGAKNMAFPWTYLLSSSGSWLFVAALLMLAVLVVVPRRWRQSLVDSGMTADAGPPDLADEGPTHQGSNSPEADPFEYQPTGARPSSTRGVCAGTATVAAGMLALFAPYLFPTATGTVLVELANGGQTSHQDWAISAQNLVTPLLLVGFLVLGWALVSLAITPRNGPAAELDGSGVVLGKEKS